MTEIKEWSKKLAEVDGRPSSPEEYESMAEFLLSRKNYEILFNRITILTNTPSCHTDDMSSFSDFWRFVLGF